MSTSTTVTVVLVDDPIPTETIAVGGFLAGYCGSTRSVPRPGRSRLAAGHALASLLALNGLRISEALGADRDQRRWRASRKVEDGGNGLTQLGEDGGAHVAAGGHDPAHRDRTKMLALSRGACDQSVELVRFDHDL